MYTRSNSVVLSLPTNNFFQDSFPMAAPMPRSKEPEIFTFDQIPVEAAQRPAAVTRQRRKNTRVMYPSHVRKYLPPTEKSVAKRWLVILCLVVFFQIWTEDAVVDSPTECAVKESCEETPFAQYQVLAFQSAEVLAEGLAEEQGGLWSNSVEPEQQQEPEQQANEVIDTTCQSCTEEIKCPPEPSTSNGYVVALLYPVYHSRLGSDD